MEKEFEEQLAGYREKLGEVSMERMIWLMKEDGMIVFSAMRAVSKLYQMNPRDVTRIVLDHPAYTARDKEFEAKLAIYKEKLDEVSIERMIWLMKEDGLPIISAIKAVHDLYHVSLRDAKQTVSSHPAYEPIHRANEPFHQMLEDMARKMESEQEGE